MVSNSSAEEARDTTSALVTVLIKPETWIKGDSPAGCRGLVCAGLRERACAVGGRSDEVVGAMPNVDGPCDDDNNSSAEDRRRNSGG